MRILLVCERSGGHIFPALAWAKKLKRENEIYFFATDSFFKTFLEKEGFLVYGKSFSRRALIRESLYRLVESIYLLFKLRPECLIGFGGRDSFFLILLGSLLGLDTAIYEPNLKMGRANKVLSFFVQNVFRGFMDSPKRGKTKVIGIPLRENIKRIDKLEAKKKLNFDESPVVLCFGGSTGSSFINYIFLKLIQNLGGNYQIIHLTGIGDYFEIFKFYNKIEKKKFVKDFYYSMGELYTCADLVISRAGASTLAELSFYKIPSILFSHPGGGGHQRENALYFKGKGGAFVFFEDDFHFEEFKIAAEKLLYNQTEREEMKKSLSKIKLGVSFEEFTV